MTTRLEMVKEFHKEAGGAGELLAQINMIHEEYKEVMNELEFGYTNVFGENTYETWFDISDLNKAALCKEIEDLIYVLIGLSYLLGFDSEGAFAEVHRSNMSKFIGGIQRRADGKILKGPHYSPANMEAFI